MNEEQRNDLSKQLLNDWFSEENIYTILQAVEPITNEMYSHWYRDWNKNK